MKSDCGKDIKMSGNEAAECSETTVEIKIKTLDCQTYTLRVDKCVPVPELKEQIASVTGVLSEQQRLICRGRILKDDQLLSSYHVEDGHTLHLIMRQPVVPSSDSSLNQPGGEQGANSQNAGTHGNDGQELDAATGSLTELMLLTGQMIIEQGTESLLLLAWQLEGHPSVTDPLERSLLRNLGALLLVLGRTITNLQMGQTPTDALANAGPPVFLSSRGPDPIMVQPLPFLEEASFGVNPLRTFEHGSGLSGGSPASGFLPMNMSTRIRTGSLLLQREPTSSQPQGQGFPLPPNGNSDQRDAAGLDPNSSTGVSQAQDVSSSHGAAATVSDEGIFLSNILHQIMPLISEHIGAESSHEGANSVETQADENQNPGASSR